MTAPGFLFDTNVLIDPGLPSRFVPQNGKTHLQSLVLRMQAIGWECAVPAPMLAEFLRNQSARDYDAQRSATPYPVTPKPPADFLSRLGSLSVCAFDKQDALSLVEWTAQEYPSQDAYGRLKLLQAIEAAESPYHWGLSSLFRQDGGPPGWQVVKDKALALVKQTGSTTAQKAVERASGFYLEALQAEGLITAPEPTWAHVKKAARAAAQGRPADKNLYKKMKQAPTTVDWLIIGMARRRGWTIVTSEQHREFAQVSFKLTPAQVLGRLEVAGG